MNKTKADTPYHNLLTFRDSKKNFALEGDLLKMIANYNFNADNFYSQYRKLTFQFAEETNFDEQAEGNKSNRDAFTRLPKSLAITAVSLNQKYFSKPVTQNRN